jgi:hypothetical protein
VLPREQVPVGFGDAVVGQVLGFDDACAVGGEIPELRAELEAALGHHPRRQRGVVVWREVEVIRHRGVEAADAARAECGREEPALALAGERELEPRRIGDGHAEEAHRRVVRGADHPRAVDLELVHPDVPVLARRHARRVARLAHLVLVGAEEADLGGVAAPAVLGDVEARRLERPGVVVAAKSRFGAGDPVRAAAQQHVALAPDLVGRHVVAQPVGQYGLVAAAQLDLARRLDVLLGNAADRVGAHEHGAAVGRERRELQRRVGHRRARRTGGPRSGAPRLARFGRDELGREPQRRHGQRRRLGSGTGRRRGRRLRLPRRRERERNRGQRERDGEPGPT